MNGSNSRYLLGCRRFVFLGLLLLLRAVGLVVGVLVLFLAEDGVIAFREVLGLGQTHTNDTHSSILPQSFRSPSQYSRLPPCSLNLFPLL